MYGGLETGLTVVPIMVGLNSAGKSLVAEVLMLRRILSTGKKAFLVLPYVALCSEKVKLLVSILLL